MPSPAGDELLHQKFARSIASTLHTISQPLTLVQCALELLGTENPDREEQEANLKLANDQVERLVQLLEYMRALTRAYRAPASEEICVIGDVLAEVVADLQPVFHESGKTLLYRQILTDHAYAKVSAITFREELFRLMTLAQSMAKPESQVEVQFFPDGELGVIRIAQIEEVLNIAPPSLSSHSFNAEQLFALAEAFFANGGGSFAVERRPLAFTCKIPLHFRLEGDLVLQDNAIDLLPEVS